MSKKFDRFARAAFKTVTKEHGTEVPAIWTPSDGSEPHSGSVLFNDPTALFTIDQVAFEETDAWMEYYEGAFPGLAELAVGEPREIVEVEGAEYYVSMVKRLYDGKTYKAYLIPK